ncbi:Transcription factor MYB78 [Camellia lanceoleosa]|uniref:Transcription factor MYB78 n=1 Tax=Camellia lanceoleosa TaxID=1840588 RepID=A0ACC0FNJ2_9ERIC|nr:Transcription factor MYB78 [Camellia lanceoleosa]
MCWFELNWKKLQIKVVELLKSRCQTRKPHPSRTVPHSPPPLALGKSIAQQLPRRTDNEIKNYWRTRIQKQAKQLNCDVNSNEFRGTIRNFLLPRLVDQIQAESDALSSMAEHDSSATETWMIASSSQQQLLEKQLVFTDCDNDHVLANNWLNISSLTDWGGCFGGTGLASDISGFNNACCEQDMFDDAEEEEEEAMEWHIPKKLDKMFFHELDAIGGARFDDGVGGDNEVQCTMLEIVNQLDGFDL